MNFGAEEVLSMKIQQEDAVSYVCAMLFATLTADLRAFIIYEAGFCIIN